MTCSVGYPDNPCPFNHKGRVTRNACGTCKHYEPPRHILEWCMLWDREHVLCMRPISDCSTCPEKVPPERAKDTVIDWADPQAVKKYYAAKAKQWATLNPDKRTEAMLRFLENHPDYFAKYRERNKEKMRDAVRRFREKQRARKSSGSEVQSDSRGPRSERDEDLPTP